MARRVTKQFRQDSETENLPAVLTPEEEQLIKLSEKNTKFERNEVIIPRLKILQPLNPEVQEGENQYIQGAKAGMFYNTSSGKLTPGQDGMIFAVVGHTRQTLEWVPRDAGGGLVKIWGMDEGWKQLCDPMERDKFVPITREGHTIDKQRSFLIFDVNITTGEYDPSFFNLKGTGNKVASFLSTMLSQTRTKMGNGQIITPPYYYYLYKMTLDRMTNSKGTWWSPRIVKFTDKQGFHVKTQSLPNGDEIFQQAITLQEHLLEGGVTQADYDNDAVDDLSGDKVTF
jgi:hypothetical protein